jgi:hypothetical protein
MINGIKPNINVKEITKNVKRSLWSQYGSRMKYVFGRMLTMYKAGLEYDKTQPEELVNWYTKRNKKGTSPLLQFSRLMFGYNGIGVNLTPTRCDLFSEDGYKNPTEKCTSDHLIGVTKVADETVYSNDSAFKKSDWNISHMINDWLYEHLHYWFTIRITKLEHKQENLARNKHTIEEKENLIHYREGNIKLRIPSSYNNVTKHNYF